MKKTRSKRKVKKVTRKKRNPSNDRLQKISVKSWMQRNYKDYLYEKNQNGHIRGDLKYDAFISAAAEKFDIRNPPYDHWIWNLPYELGLISYTDDSTNWI